MGTAVLGAGPAGLTAAYVLGLRGVPAVVFEADGTVGGIAKTVEYNGYRFDLGGHRFFTKFAPVERLWEEVMGDEFLVAPAALADLLRRASSSRTRCRPRDVVARLGIVSRCSARSRTSGAGSRRARREAETFEDWVTPNFGNRLYDAFFRSYTEKVWGIPGSEIRSRVGGAADQGLLVREGAAARPAPQRGRRRRR